MSGEWHPVAPKAQVVLPVRVDPRGARGPTPGQARGPGWRRTSAGFYVPTPVTDDLVEQRIVEAAHRLTTGAVTGWAALRLLGGGYFDGLGRDVRTRSAVDVASGQDRFRSRPGVRVRRSAVSEDDVVVRYGVRCLAAEPALLDAMRWAHSHEDRVLAMDMAAAAGLTSVRRMAAYVRRPRGITGRSLVIWALRFAQEGALSPQEVRLRLLWQRACGPTELLCNPRVLDESGRFVAMPDLLEVGTGVAGEFAGAVHRSASQHRHDVARADRVRAVGIEPVEFVGSDLHDEALVAGRIQLARARARRQPRRWQLAPPGPQLDERLDERDRLRARYANH